MKVKTALNPRTASLTVRVPVELKRRLEGLAKSRASNRSRLATEALETYVADEELRLAKIDQGMRDADAGRVVSHQQVKRYLKSWGRKRKLAPPASRPHAARPHAD